jgi:hypothetical protein
MSAHDRAQSKASAGPVSSSASSQSTSGLLQRTCACGGTAGLTGQCAECDTERLTLHRHPLNQLEPSAPLSVPPIVDEVLRSPGQSLDGETRGFMESRLGHDFSRVRVHTDARAAKSARQVNALAYTVGHNVVFETGQYQPGTARGRQLLAHELTHVAQQARSQPGSAVRIVPDSDASEVEARQHANAIASETASSHAASETSPTPLQLTRVGKPGGKPGFKITPADMENLRATMEELLNSLDAKTRNSMTRNKTIVIGLVVDEDGDPTMVYTVSNNWTNKNLRDNAEKMGITRWESTGRAEGRGLIGAPGDAEQLMIEAADENRFKVSGMAVSRTVCLDCQEEIHAYEHGPISVVEVKNPTQPAQKTPPPAANVPEGGEAEGQTRLRIGAVEGEAEGETRLRIGAVEGEGKSRISTGTRISVPEVDEGEVEVVPARRARAVATASEGPGDMPPSPRTTIMGVTLSFVAGVGVNLLNGAFRSKVENDLAKLPKPKIDNRSAKGFLSDPNTAESMRLIDVLSKDLLPFGRELQTKQQQVLAAAQLKMLAVSVSTLDAEGRLEYLSSIGEELSAYESQLSTVEDNLDAILEQKESALKTAKACDDLVKFLNNAWVEKHWIETGFTIEDHGAAESNLLNLAVTIRMAFRDAQALKNKITKLDEEEMAFKANWKVAFNQEFAIVFEARLKEEQEKSKAAALAVKPSPAPTSAPRKKQPEPIAPEILPTPGVAAKPPEYSPLAAIQPWDDRVKGAGDVASKFEQQKNWLVAAESKLREMDHRNRRDSAEYKTLYKQFDQTRTVWPGQLDQSIALLEKENAQGYEQSINRLKALRDWLRTEGKALLDQVLPPG